MSNRIHKPGQKMHILCDILGDYVKGEDLYQLAVMTLDKVQVLRIQAQE